MWRKGPWGWEADERNKKNKCKWDRGGKKLNRQFEIKHREGENVVWNGKKILAGRNRKI